MIFAKSLDKGKKVSTLKIEGLSYQTKLQSGKDIDALYALLGGYNQVARHVDIGQYQELRQKFNEVVSDMAELL